MVLQASPSMARRGAGPVRRKAPTVLMFGVGAPRCGTTWLYEFLSQHPDCHFRGIKELHYFDSFQSFHVGWTLDQVEELFHSLQEAALVAEGAARQKILGRLADTHEYYQLMKKRVDDRAGYAHFLLNGIGSKKLVGDITPTYCILPVETFHEMAATSAHSRFVYIMREPIERLWSNVRMLVRSTRAAKEDYDRLATEILIGILGDQPTEHDKILLFSDYVSAIGKLRAAVPPERSMVTFTEDMLTQTGARKLCKFLDIRPVRAELDKKVNAAEQANMPAELRAELRRRLRPQYEFMAQNFAVLPAAWQKTISEGFA